MNSTRIGDALPSRARTCRYASRWHHCNKWNRTQMDLASLQAVFVQGPWYRCHNFGHFPPSSLSLRTRMIHSDESRSKSVDCRHSCFNYTSSIIDILTRIVISACKIPLACKQDENVLSLDKSKLSRDLFQIQDFPRSSYIFSDSDSKMLFKKWQQFLRSYISQTRFSSILLLLIYGVKSQLYQSSEFKSLICI